MIQRKKRISGEINASSMADITFLLLIFFLVTTTISSDKGIKFVLPPKSDNAAEGAKMKGVVNVFISDENRIMLGTKNKEVEVDISQVKSRLQVLKKEITSKGDPIIVSVKAMEGSTYKTYLDVIDQITSAKIERISLAQ
jgi:biopolymer transport protein ExbD